MHSDDAPDRTPLPDVYTTLMQRVGLAIANENVWRAMSRAFDLDASVHSDHDEAVLRVLLSVRLAPDGAMRAKDMSVQMLKSTSHMSRLIDRAAASGLVERLPDPADRRAHRVALTPKGLETIDAYVPHAVAMLEQAYGEALDADEQRLLLELLGRVEASVTKLIAEREAAARRQEGR
ncbi:MAG: MarR family winged helix-turn-helix transcriptional regulator [Myxococcota bacterium]